MSVAYLSAEVGLESAFHTYSGGLGVLAGDHIKSAADAGVDLVACTLLYREGYGRQHLDSSGNQTETYAEIDPFEFLCETGIEIELPLDGTILHSKVWLYRIKGLCTYFLDTRHPNNSPSHASLGNRLYGGDDETRIRQEYLLGVGGIRALQALNHEITGLHLNEGHCTFAMLEMLNQGWSREHLSKNCLFTTHTPVPAGHDRFEWESVKSILGNMLPDDARQLCIDAGDPEEGRRCSMSHLAVALSGPVNAVSNLNAWVASSMFAEQHIAPITNGVHHLTWTAPPMAELFDEHLEGWRSKPASLAHAGGLPNTGLISAREECRSVLRDLVKASTGVELHPDRLTIGFARRFATYKRANLIFRDIERLRSIGANRIQFVFAGKAHPRDEGGKQLIRDIFAGASEVADDIPVAFLEDYSMDTGLAMTSGVDIWLNNPIRPMEASGTSGMKAAMNGVPNCSILDGWWPEGCEHGVNGWAIGEGEDDRDDARDAENIYHILEGEVLPAWESGPERWAEIMRASIATSARFTGARMMSDYQRFYDAFGNH
ncbi:MAG: alpha-glucan family phosphorylase [Candidatus Thermoplasmatota archaeon]|nr:alpha-glucan family phosphorylase [Candidatus Thermoplasmatota archaeon]MEE3083402.1 alpha-glucan family phosphorylase [Candidatus Thermoplasmatota archaeon]